MECGPPRPEAPARGACAPSRPALPSRRIVGTFARSRRPASRAPAGRGPPPRRARGPGAWRARHPGTSQSTRGSPCLMTCRAATRSPRAPRACPPQRPPRSSRCRRRRVELRIAPGRPSGSATSDVRMLAYNGSIPGPDPEGAPGVGGAWSTSSTRATWRPPSIGTACASTTAPTAPTRRRSRSRWEDASRAASRSRIPACTGTTPTSARTTARRWASTATSSSSRRTPTTGRRSTASWS